MRRKLILAAACPLLFDSMGWAQAIPAPTSFALQPVFDVGITAYDMARNGNDKLYVSDYFGGAVKSYDTNGNVSTFLDVAGNANLRFTTNFAGGLFGIAFHPDYNDNTKPGYHKFYTYNTDYKTTTQTNAAPNSNATPGNPLTGLPDLWHPEMYAPATSGDPLTNWTNPDSASAGNTDFSHFNVVREWTALANGSAIDTSIAPRVVLRMAHGFINKGAHNGGALRFGADGDLYITVGDGGGNAGQDHDGGITNGEDGHTNTTGNGQDLTNHYGKVLRIDPIVSNPGNLSANGQYRIPTGVNGNPFVDGPGGNTDEIFAYAFRNPWKMEFDANTGSLFLSDVGQHHREEIDLIQKGKNYGWGYMEGNARLVSEDNQSGVGDTGNGTNIRTPGIGYAAFKADPNYQAPLVDYLTRRQYPTGTVGTSEDLRIGDGVAATGGFVYRGSMIPELYGKYVFGDVQYRVVAAGGAVLRDSGRLFYIDLNAPTQMYEMTLETGFTFGTQQLLGFGQDATGELYALLDNGMVTRIVSGPTWNLDADGTWGNTPNWINSVPGAAGARANFGANITAARTITLDTNRTVGTINLNSPNPYTLAGPSSITLDNGGGTAALNVFRGNHTINAPISLNSNAVLHVQSAADSLTLGGTFTATGRSITKTGAGQVQLENIRAGTLAVNAGTAKVRSRVGLPNQSDGTSRVSSLSIAAGAKLDLTNNAMVIDYTTVGTLLDEIRQHLQAGRLATSDPGFAGGTHRLGYADNAGLLLNTFEGQDVSTHNNVLIKFTYNGDANLDGKVNADDLGLLAGHWQSASVWKGGDFNYDGFVDIKDIILMALNWQQGVASPLPGESLGPTLASFGLPVVAPEPASIGLVGIGIGAMLTRRRRRGHRSRIFHHPV